MKKGVSMADLIAWVYGAQKAHRTIDQGRGLLPDERRADGRMVQMVSGDGVARCMENAILGVEIDYFGPDAGSIHPDAEEVHDLVRSATALRMMDYVQVGQLIHYGETGIAPNWMPAAVPEIRPVIGRKGKPKLLYEDPARSRGAYACVLQIVRSRQDIDLAREVYSHFVDAMSILQFYYQDNPLKLINYRVTGLGIPRHPWQKVIDFGGSS